MSDNNQLESDSPKEISLSVVPDCLQEFVEYRKFHSVMRPYSTLTIVVAVLLGLIICGVLLRPENLQNKLFQCHLALFIGVLIGGGSISKKKVPDAISTGLWGCYSIATGMALTQMPAMLDQEEFTNRMLILALPYVAIGSFLIWTAVEYVQEQSIKILSKQVLGFATLFIVHISVFLIGTVRIVRDPELANVLGKGAVQNIFIGLWLAALASICSSFYTRFKGKTPELSENSVRLAERIIREIKASRGTGAEGIIEIMGDGPAWIGKLWADSLFFVIEDDRDVNEEIYLVRKSDFKLVKCLTSKEKRSSGFVNVKFKVNGDRYKGLMSGKSYHRYEKWKQN